MKKRLLSILLALALLCAILPAVALSARAAATSGTCGDNLTWTFDSATGTLTIKGSGKMYHYYSATMPWDSFIESIRKITIGNSVTSIGNCAFYCCASLTSVTIGNSVSSIGSGAFSNCTSLTSVSIPNSVTSIGGGAFSSCFSLTSVSIPNSVTSIGSGAFSSCVSLTSVTIPESITSISKATFRNCSALTSVTIPSSVTSIGSWAFGECSALTSVVIPESVTSIGDSAFTYCTSLRSVTIPNSVTSIDELAFSHCTSLTSVTIPSSVTSIGDFAFEVHSRDLVIYGLSGSYAEEYANENYIPFVALSVPKITTQPKSAAAAVGQSATFKVVATGNMLSYQWQYRRAGATSWTNYSGKTEATLTVKGGSNNNGCQYRCVVSNPLGKKNSAAATLTVTTVAKPVITTQPKSVSMALGECMTFSCGATGQGTLTYQWQYKRSGETSWTNWSGKTEPILNVVAGSNNNGCRYRCAVTNDGGTTYTDTATLTITSSHECPGAAFTDMPAQGTIEHTAIDWAIRAGVTNGTSATTFSPNRVLTRSQVVTFLWRACGSPEPKTTQNPFTDVKTTDWFYKAVLWAVEEGITTGTSSTKFSPSRTCSRSQTLTFLYRQQGSPAVGSVTVPYTDVQSGAFYENAMKWAYSNGIDKGVTATTFAPSDNCVRVSNVVFLYRAITGQGRLK